MKITEVNVRKVDSVNAHMRAMASVKLDDCFVIHGIRVIEGEKGLFTAMPSRKSKDGEYHDVAHPITQECREMFNNAIIDEYNKIKDEDE